MKCPYTVDSHQHTQDTYEYDDEGRVVAEIRKVIEKRPFVDCVENNCAAWSDGRCNYRGN